ncbi:MAG: c-type cytochrome [Bacteroidetes bacterium]|nr:c-type cytochrome [Bacteroidota bacterium]
MKFKIYIPVLILIVIIGGFVFKAPIQAYVKGIFSSWPQYDVNSLPNDSLGNMIRYGHRLITETSNIVGADVENKSMRYAGNNLECQNCHFNGGMDKNTMSYIGVSNRYPALSKRHNRMSDLTERVEDCFERSLNGRKLPPDSYELKSILAYMNWLSKGIPKDLQGVTINDIDFPKREPDIEKGKRIYDTRCITCHAYGGLGTLKNPQEIGVKYLVPPICGDDSFNDGAGMSKMERLVKFLKTQMPRDNPGSLSLDEAYDAAGFVASLKRPEFKGGK